MNHRIVLPILLLLSLVAAPALAGGMEDDPLLFSVMVDKLEMQATEGSNPLKWDAEAWVGKDRNKLWFKTEGAQRDGKIADAEFQALYSRAVHPFWDFQVGLRRDVSQEPGVPDRNWLALGFEGTAPYFIDVDAAVFVGDEGRTALRLKTKYEFLFTQRLALVPELDVDCFGKDDPATRTGSGLSSSELGLRLKYEVRREFAPYIGVSWTRLWGRTADYAREDGGHFDSAAFVVGLSFRF